MIIRLSPLQQYTRQQLFNILSDSTVICFYGFDYKLHTATIPPRDLHCPSTEPKLFNKIFKLRAHYYLAE